AAPLAARRRRARAVPAVDRGHAARADRRRAGLPVRAPLSSLNPRVPNVGDRAARRRRRPARPLPAPRRRKEARRMAGAELRVGVIGTGRWAKMAHLPGWSRDPRVQLVAVCDADEAVAAEAAGMFGVAEHVTDHRAVIERDDIDVIDVVTGDHGHFELTMAALEAGKHVLVEKPVAH